MCTLTHSLFGVGEVVIPLTARGVPPPIDQCTVTACVSECACIVTGDTSPLVTGSDFYLPTSYELPEHTRHYDLVILFKLAPVCRCSYIIMTMLYCDGV